MIAPEGYELSTETVTFVVKEDGTVDGELLCIINLKQLKFQILHHLKL